MTIERSDLEKVAELARLELAEDEVEALTRDCRAILDHFEAVRAIDLSGVEPAGALERPAPLREDRVDHDRLERLLEEMAPAWREGYFVLPRLRAMEFEEAEG